MRQKLTSISLSFAIASVIQIGHAPKALAEKLVKEVGNIRAEISYPSDRPVAENVRLKISRNNSIVFNGIIADRTSRMLTLSIQDLDGDKEPEVIFNHNPGMGTRCCTASQIYGYQRASKKYTAATGNWGGAGFPKVQDLNGDGKYEFLYMDWRFAYAFTSFADSALPIRIWQYRQGKVTETTSQYPQVIRQRIKDGNKWYQTLVSENRELKGSFAAYAAEKFLLGEREEALAEIQRNYPGNDKQEFITQLLGFLKKTGYTAIPQK